MFNDCGDVYLENYIQLPLPKQQVFHRFPAGVHSTIFYVNFWA